jgi:iron complex outermembrane receptor protein
MAHRSTAFTFAPSALAVAIAFLSSGAASAAETIEEIVVTAAKRGDQALQDTPMTIQAITGATLEALGASSIEDIAGRVPGFTAFNAGTNQKKLKMRGISSTSESEPQETVSVYLDDVPMTGNGGTNNENGSSPDLSLFDLERVEVLKGPQSTLYGAGAMGGTVRYITNRPDTEAFAGKVGAGLSSTKSGDESWKTDLMLNVPLSDAFAVRVVGGYRSDGGYIDNLVQTGTAYQTKKGPEDNTDGSDLTTGTITALWKPTEQLNILGRYSKHEYNVDGESSVDRDVKVKVAGLKLDRDDLEQVRFLEEVNEDDIDVYSLTIEYDLGWASLTSATSRYERTVYDVQDTSVVPQLFFGVPSAVVGGPTQIAAPLVNDNKHEQTVEELRLASQGDGALSWVVGYYWFDMDKSFSQNGVVEGLDDWLGGLTDLLGNPDIPYEAVTDQTMEQTAVFGEVTWDFADAWSLVAGLRWFKAKQDFSQAANGLINGGATLRTGDADEDDVNPKATLSYKASDDVMFYGTVSRGYRIGGINQPVPLDAGTGCRAEVNALGLTAAPLDFGSDYIWNYELGAKSTLADGRVQLNAAAYHIDWKDIQVRKQLACGFTFFTNTAKATVDGFEVDLQAQVTDAFFLSATAGYNNGQLDKDDAFLGAESGDTVPGVSDFTFSASAEYSFPLAGRDAFLRADYTYGSQFDSQFRTNDPANREAGGFGILNVRTGVDLMEDWNVSLFLNNVADERGVSGTQSNLFGDYEFIVRPRTVGLSTLYSF